MAQKQDQNFDTTRAWLSHNIERFMVANLQFGWLDGEAFGWAACRDSNLVKRLEDGGDVRTRKMDDILAFIQNPVAPEKWAKLGHILTPIKLTRRVYE